MDHESPSKSARWPLLRVSPGHDCVVELLSGHWIRLVTHYASRTVLCPEDYRCELCDILPARPFWYLPAFVEPTRRPCLLELSASTSADLEQVAKFCGGEVDAGLRLRLSRRTSKSPIRCEALEPPESVQRSPVQQWGTCLMAIFGFPAFGVGETVDRYGDRVREIALQRAAVAAGRLRAGVKGR